MGSAEHSGNTPLEIKPVRLPGIAFFEVLEASRVPVLNPFAIIFALSVVLGMYFALQEMYGYVVVCVMMAVIIFTIPQVVTAVRRRNTYYELFETKIVFHLYEAFTHEERELELDDVKAFKYEAYLNDAGHVHIITREEPPFRTRSFAGKLRFYPALESVPDCIELTRRLNGLLERTDADRPESALP